MDFWLFACKTSLPYLQPTHLLLEQYCHKDGHFKVREEVTGTLAATADAKGTELVASLAVSTSSTKPVWIPPVRGKKSCSKTLSCRNRAPQKNGHHYYSRTFDKRLTELRTPSQ